MRDFARYVILAPLMTAVAAPAMAQTIPPGQSCGGLFCDMGLFGHKVPVGADGKSLPEPTTRTASGEVVVAEPADPHRLACHDFLCHAFGQSYGEAEAAPAAAGPVAVAAAPEATAKPVYKAHRKHVARADAAATESAAK